MAHIYETGNFFVESVERPLIPREEGGHLRIVSKDTSISDRTKLEPQLAVELMRLSMITGEALETAMNKRGIKVIKVNFQDMGNWAWKDNKKLVLHYHIFGRVLGAKHQPFPESMYLPDRDSGFYDGFTPLNAEDNAEILKEIERIAAEPKYQLNKWSLS